MTDAATVLSVAGDANAQVDLFSRGGRFERGRIIIAKAGDFPWDLIGGDVEKTLGIRGRAGPLGTTVDIEHEGWTGFIDGGECAVVGSLEGGKHGVFCSGKVGEICFGVGASSEGFWELGGGLVRGGFVAWETVSFNANEAKIVKGLAGDAVEQEGVSNLGDLSYGIDPETMSFNGDEVWWGWDIPIPDIVTEFLKMPEAFSGKGIESDEAVGKEIVPAMVHPEEVWFRRPRGNVSDAAGGIHGHAAPAVCSGFEGAPCFVPILAGVGSGGEFPK